MSELIDMRDNRATIRWKLLTGASALALTAYITSAATAKAEEAGHPVLWLELGGQVEMQQGLSSPFVAPFMTLSPVPDVYQGVDLVGSQREARFAFGGDGKITFQPEDSDWLFSAGIRYGRSHANRHAHKQLPRDPVPYSFSFTFYGNVYNYAGTKYVQSSALADTETQTSEHHTILDFQAGKDVGLGMFGRNSSSVLSAGVRFASFASNTSAYITARPAINYHISHLSFYGADIPKYQFTFYQYTMHAKATRSFKGIGPSLSWNASAALVGNDQDGELTLDWGINAAILFGKQKATTSHDTRERHSTPGKYATSPYPQVYHHYYNNARSRSVIVPNVGGFAGISLKWPNAKVSVGYRADMFFNAMDTGIDAARKSTVTFHGPFASISIGMGD